METVEVVVKKRGRPKKILTPEEELKLKQKEERRLKRLEAKKNNLDTDEKKVKDTANKIKKNIGTFEEMFKPAKGSKQYEYHQKLGLDKRISNEKLLERIKRDETLSDFDRQYMMDYFSKKNEKLIFKMASYMQSDTVSYQERIDAGYYGYAKAIETFDLDRGFKFSTLAMNCVRNEINTLFRKDNQWKEQTQSMEWVIGHDKNGKGFTVAETIRDETLTAEEQLLQDTKFNMLRGFMDQLCIDEKFVLYMRFGFIPQFNKWTQSTLADFMETTQANVSKLERTGLDKMKYMVNNSDII